jgi:two-component system NarL family response regulator
LARAVRTIRILIADECGLCRDALRVALEREPDLEVVADVTDGETAVAAAEETRPQVAILRLSLAAYSRVRVSCMITDRVADCRTIVLADTADQQLLADGLGCGASAYLTKDCSLSELVDAVRAVVGGETLIPPRMLGPLLSNLIDRRHNHENALHTVLQLSPREREVLALVAQGQKNDAIAETLVISRETVRTHVQNILAKLGVHSRFEAATFVFQNGLLDHLGVRSLGRSLELKEDGR